MTFLDARSQYRRANSGATTVPEDPHGIVLFTLRELERALQVVATAMADDRPMPDLHLTRALTAIYVLQSSLDFEKGGEISDNLFKVYEHCRQQLLATFRREDGADLGRCAQLIGGIISAWAQIAPNPAAA